MLIELKKPYMKRTSDTINKRILFQSIFDENKFSSNILGKDEIVIGGDGEVGVGIKGFEMGLIVNAVLLDVF